MILFVVCSIATGFAQSPSDFELKVNVKNASCMRNGIIEIRANKRIGTPNYIYSLGFNLSNSQGQYIFRKGESTPNNIFGNLAPGVYTPVVYVYVKDNASQEIVRTIKLEGSQTSLTTSYKQPTFITSLVRKPLPFYKENGVHNPATGIITISIHDGNGPYTVLLKSAPVGYKCERERTFEKNGTLSYYGVIPGDYVFSASDMCGVLGERTIHVDYVSDPYPQQDSEFPIGVYFYQSEDIGSIPKSV